MEGSAVRKTISNGAFALAGLCLAALAGPSAQAGAPAQRAAPSPAVPAAPLKAFAKVKNPKAIGGVWLIYSTGGIAPYADPPMHEAGKAKVAAFRAKYNEADLRANPPNQACVQAGMPSSMGGIGMQPMEIHVAPDRITVMTESGPTTRRIYLTKDKETPEGLPTRSGWSNAKWEGDTLVVTTSLISEWLMGRWSHTEDAVVTERWTLRNTADLGTTVPRNQPIDPGDPVGPLTLVSEVTMHEPALYPADLKGTLYFRKIADDEFQEVSCVEGLFWEAMNTRWRKREAGEADAIVRSGAPTSNLGPGFAPAAGAPGLLQGPPLGGRPAAPPPAK